MVSPELLRRYPFFAGFNEEQIIVLAEAAHEESVDPGHVFFQDGDRLEEFYLLIQGEIAILMELPDRTTIQSVSRQLMRELLTREIVTSTVISGDLFAWSALVPPFKATAKAKALSPSRLAVFNGETLRNRMQKDCSFGYLMMQKIAQLIRDRLNDSRVETLAFFDTE